MALDLILVFFNLRKESVLYVSFFLLLAGDISELLSNASQAGVGLDGLAWEDAGRVQ